MSGHSKWSKVKHQKAGTDAVKSSAFTKASRAITLAVREGGGITDPSKNFRLRLAIDSARGVNMPKDTIDRAIERAGGSGAGELVSVLYEAYGPAGAAILIEAATDNRQRTVSEVKNIIERAGGNLAAPGSVGYQFQKCGVVTVGRIEGLTYDQVLAAAIDAGATDVVVTDDMYEVYAEYETTATVAEKLKNASLPVDASRHIFRPANTIDIPEPARRAATKIVELLEQHPDVQAVYTNFS